MNVGFYYHVEVSPADDGVRVPSHIGLFLRELAAQAGTVTLFAHRGAVDADDVVLPDPPVRFVDLGPKRSFPARTFRPGSDIRRFRTGRQGLDVMLVRGPSPLLPAIVGASRSFPVCIWLQGDYATATARHDQPRWRKGLVEVWKRIYAVQQDKAVRRTAVIVNSASLRSSRNTGAAPEVFSSNLPEGVAAAVGMPKPTWSTPGTPVHLLYVGRLAEEKGLLDLVEALRLVRDRDVDAVLDLVGAGDEPFISALADKVNEKDLGAAVRFCGYLPYGDPLFDAYRCADIFILPSYHEGFPHVLAEAMAFGLPVIATEVGGIGAVLRDGESGLMVKPGSPGDIASAIERLATDEAVRSRIAVEGWKWAKHRTLERSCGLLIEHLRRLVDSGSTEDERATRRTEG